MMRRLVLDIPFTPGSMFAWQTDYRTMRYQVTRNGVPVLECDTKQERDDWIADAEMEVRNHTPKAAVTVFAAADSRQAIDDLFGPE